MFNKKFSLFLLTAIILTELLFFKKIPANQTSAIENEAEKAIIMLKDTKGYVLENGELIEQAIFKEKNSYTFLLEDDLYYYLPFGNDTLVVKKDLAKKSNDIIEGTIPKGEKTVITTKEVSVTNREKGGNVIGHINSGLRLPIISETEKHYSMNMGGQIGYVLKSQTTVDNGIPVLMYHHLIENRAQTKFVDNNMVIDLLQFKEQLAYLKENGWKTISIADLDNWLHLRKNLPDRVVVISFDDGLLSTIRYAYPLLQDYGFKATSFLITGKIRQQAEDWSEDSLQYVGLKEIRESTDVFDYQHHTNYMHLRDKESGEPLLTFSSYDEVRSDIEDGKFQISKAFDFDQSHIRYLAYPFGQFNETSKKAIQDSGIRMAFTTNTGNVNLGDNRFELQRQGIGPTHSLIDFEKKLLGTFK